MFGLLIHDCGVELLSVNGSLCLVRPSHIFFCELLILNPMKCCSIPWRALPPSPLKLFETLVRGGDGDGDGYMDGDRDGDGDSSLTGYDHYFQDVMPSLVMYVKKRW